MTNRDWWARVVQTRARHDDLLLQRVWTIRKDGHEVAVDLRAVPAIGAEPVLCVDGKLRRTRLYRAHEQAELSGAIADTRTTFEAQGWARGRQGADPTRTGNRPLGGTLDGPITYPLAAIGALTDDHQNCTVY